MDDLLKERLDRQHRLYHLNVGAESRLHVKLDISGTNLDDG